MKYLIFVLALFLAFSLSAQDAVSSDTSYIENRSGVFWQVTQTTYESGRIVSDQTPIGSDTATVVNAVIGSLFPSLTQYADAAVQATKLNQQRKRVTEKYSRATLNTVNARLAALGLSSYTDQLATRLGTALQGEYTWSAPGIVTPVAVTVNANLRFNPGTGVRQIRILKDGFIRVTQGGVTLAELFLVNRRYVSYDNKYILRLPNNVQSLGE